MTNEPADDQYAIDYSEIDTHAPVTPKTVSAAINLLFLTGKRERDYEMLVNFLEPKTEDEKRIIRDAIECEQIKRDWCGE